MNRINSFKKIILLLAITVLVLSAVIFFIFVDIKNKSLNVYNLERELEDQTQRSQYFLSMKRMVENADNEIDQVNSSILSSDGDVAIIEQIEGLAQRNGLEIDIDSIMIEDTPTLSDKSLAILKIKAKTKGGWSGTYKFISGLESMEQKIKVNRIVVNTTDEDSQDPKLSATKWQTVFEIILLKNK